MMTSHVSPHAPRQPVNPECTTCTLSSGKMNYKWDWICPDVIPVLVWCLKGASELQVGVCDLPTHKHTQTPKNCWAPKPSSCCTCTSMPLIFLIRNSVYFTLASTRHSSLMLVRSVRGSILWKPSSFWGCTFWDRECRINVFFRLLCEKRWLYYGDDSLPSVFTLVGFPLL